MKKLSIIIVAIFAVILSLGFAAVTQPSKTQKNETSPTFANKELGSSTINTAQF